MFVKDDGCWYDEHGAPVDNLMERLEQANEVILTVVPFLDDALSLPFARTAAGTWDEQLEDAINRCISPAFVHTAH
jgi:hypothetical protein